MSLYFCVMFWMNCIIPKILKLQNTETDKQGIKKTLRMGENNSKWNNWQRINFQNIQEAYTTQYQENNPIKKWGKDLNRHFSKDDILMGNKHMKRCSTLLNVREMQIKTTMKYHLTLDRMAIIKSLETIHAWEGVEKRECCCTVGNVNWQSHYGRWYGDSLKN